MEGSAITLTLKPGSENILKKELIAILKIEDTTYCGNIIKKNHMLIFSLIYPLLNDKIISKLRNQGIVAERDKGNLVKTLKVISIGEEPLLMER